MAGFWRRAQRELAAENMSKKERITSRVERSLGAERPFLFENRTLPSPEALSSVVTEEVLRGGAGSLRGPLRGHSAE